MKKPTKTALAIGLLFSSSNLWADSLLDIYNLAKDNDPSYLASDAGRLATNERVNQSMAGLLPQLSASWSYTKSDSESEGVTTVFDDPTTPVDESGVTNSNNESDGTSSGYSISLNQEIYNHSTWLSLRQSEKRALQSNVNHESSKHDLIIRVAEAYFNVLAAQDSVDFSKSETEAVSKELAQTKQRFEVGLIAMTDVHEAQSRHDRAVANQISAQNALDNAHESLQQITGQYHYDLLGLKQEIPLRNPQPEDIKKWVKESEQNNVTVKASKIGLEIAKQSISISQAGHFPTVGLQASYSDSSSDNNSAGTSFLGATVDTSRTNSDSDGQSSSISLNVNIPIFSGGRTNSQVKEAQQLYLQAAHNLEADHRRAVSDTRSSYLGVVAAVSSVNALKQAVISSQSALEATQAGFEVGTRTIVDVLQQTQQLFDSKRQHARARYDYILNTLRLKRAAGLLAEEDLAKINQMLR
ncbi:TolC family outer membrane protein [Aliikangiella coralliicola]|uniref:TolC family outer membrane protein n=1 Tax=Aliikangiella coralliicola TaxID=2592383 RepID=A0A545UC00_9GAMM|nr:TolC family outer membrane protein [Aliikangiella coralliicola]TQV86990.1 TolC family outer membrane protein [Aliikangiella coralliicola]